MFKILEEIYDILKDEIVSISTEVYQRYLLAGKNDLIQRVLGCGLA